MTKVTIATTNEALDEIRWRFEVYCVIVCGVYLWDCPAVEFTASEGLSFRTRDWGTDGTARALEIRRAA